MKQLKIAFEPANMLIEILELRIITSSFRTPVIYQ